MEKGIMNCFGENKALSPKSKIKMPHQSLWKTGISDKEIISFSIPVLETAKCKSQVLAVQSTECSLGDIGALNTTIVKLVPSNANINSSESIKELPKSRNGDEELWNLLNIQIEETAEMLDIISRTKEKSEFFIFHVDYLVKSLQEISKHSAASCNKGNTYVRNMYRKKLEEFASCLLDKIKKSIKELEADYLLLKEQKEKTEEIFKKITESHRSFDSYTAEIAKKVFLKENINQLIKEISSMIPKQLSKIDKLSYIEPDIEMLYDLYHRFSSIEDSNLINF